MFIAQLANGVVTSITQTNGIPLDASHVEIASFDTSLLGCTYADGVFIPPPPPAPVRRATKRAFQNRFPKTSNGISTKWDAMCLFLSDDGYAASLGVTGAALYGLRLLITTGQQRMNASPFVDMEQGGEAAALTALLAQPSIPVDFRLSNAERELMLSAPLLDSEIYKG
jgi:hypothetical protein